jgi:uncharacterized protein (TIGR02271 family)
MASQQDRLKSLSELGDYEVSREDNDVRGWTVVAADGQRVGTVSDLIVDTDRMKVEYLAVQPHDGTGPTMVPVNSAQLDTRDKEVVVGGALGQSAVTERTTTSERMSSDAGVSRTEHMRDAGREDRDGGRLTRAEEELRIDKREVRKGEVVVGKHVETERVSEPVTVERERVHVERRPVSGDSFRGAADIGEDEIRIPVHEEELIVEKRPVVKEELVISKERERDTENVETELRKERFDVDADPSLLRESEAGSKRKGRS